MLRFNKKIGSQLPNFLSTVVQFAPVADPNIKYCRASYRSSENEKEFYCTEVARF